MVEADASSRSGRPFQGRSVVRLSEAIRGRVILPDDEEYDRARQIYNAMIDRHPRMIVRCRGVADIIEAVRYARAQDMIVSVRGSGHSAAGHAVCDDGLVIDLTEMKAVRVDPAVKRAWAEPGVTWADFDHETQAFGLATPGGTVSSTSISGLTLGGGIGWLMGSYGLTCDNLLGADLITAEGKLVRATENINPDLFWALRGGGGNFGVVSLFEFRLHEVDRVIAGSMRVPIERASEVLLSFRESSENVPDELTLCPTFFRSPIGTPYLSVDFCYNGELHAGWECAREAERRFRPEVSTVEAQSYIRWQKYLDASFGERLRGYWKSAFLDCLDNHLIAAIIDFYRCAPSSKSTVILEHFHGRMTHVDVNDSAYANRDKPFSLLITTRWQDPADDDQNISWANAFYTAVQPYTDGSSYLNYIGETGDHSIRLTYGQEHYDRLAEIKRKYDPDNFFNMNHNIKPKAGLASTRIPTSHWKVKNG